MTVFNVQSTANTTTAHKKKLQWANEAAAYADYWAY